MSSEDSYYTMSYMEEERLFEPEKFEDNNPEIQIPLLRENTLPIIQYETSSSESDNDYVEIILQYKELIVVILLILVYLWYEMDVCKTKNSKYVYGGTILL